MDHDAKQRVLDALPLRLIGLAIGGAAVWWAISPAQLADLDVHYLGERSGDTLVLLHGYGAPGDDLLPLGREISASLPSLRIVVVEAPHRAGLGGRAWFNGPESRTASVAQLRRLLADLEADASPRSRTIVAGFSQGGEMAARIGMEESLRGVALLSAPSTSGTLRGPVFMSHGRGDTIVGFAGADHVRGQYAQTADVTWVPFDGGHAIPQHVRDALIAWLREVLS